MRYDNSNDYEKHKCGANSFRTIFEQITETTVRLI